MVTREYDSYLAGVCYLDLIDFDQDGTEELLVYYKDAGADTYDRYSFDIYQYNKRSGEAEKAVSAEGTGETNGGWRSVEITEVGGKPYIVADIWDEEICTKLYGDVNGEIREAMEFRTEGNNTSEIKFFVNNAEVTQENYTAMQESWYSEFSSYLLMPVGASGDDGQSTDDTIAKMNEIRRKLGMGNVEMSEETVSEETTGTAADTSKNLVADVEACVSEIRTLYGTIMDNYAARIYSQTSLRDGITAYYEGDALRMVIVPAGVDDSTYIRYYYYDQGQLFFAYYEGSDAHRFYFSAGNMIRWRYTSDASNPDDASNHDQESTGEYQNWEAQVLSAADEFLQ